MAKGIEVAQAYVTIIPSMKGIQGDIAKQLGADVVGEDAGRKLGSGIVSGLASAAGNIAAAVAKTVAAGTAVAAAGIATISKASLDSYAEYEQLAGGVEKLYGSSASTIQQYAIDAYKTAGMSANDYMTQATNFSASLIKSVGGDTAEAARLTDVAMRAMSDNINTFGSNASDVQNAFMGFAKQNYAMLDNLKLGYAGTQQGMMQLINDSGVLGYTLTDTSQLASVGFGTMVEAIQAVQEQQGIAGTTAKEAASTISGSIEMTKASWANLLTELGKDDGDVSARVEELVDSALLVVENAAPKLVQIVGTLISKVPEAIMQQAPKVKQAMTELLDNMTDGGFSKAKAKIQPAIDKIGAAISGLIDRLAPLAPYAQQIGSAMGSILVTAINLVADAISFLAPIIATVAEHAMPILAAGMDAVASAFEFAQGVIEPFADFMSSVLTVAIDALGQGIEDVATAVLEGFEIIFDALGSVGDFLADPLGAIKNWGKDVSGSFKSTGKTITKTADSTERSVSKSFGKLTSNSLASSKKMQKGVTSDYSAMDKASSKALTDMMKTASNKFSALNKEATSQTNSVASITEKNSKRVATAWDRSYKLMLSSDASTAAAEEKLSKFTSKWDKTTIAFLSSGDTGGALSKFNPFWSSWNNSTVNFNSSGSTSGVLSKFNPFWNSWNGSTVHFYSSGDTSSADYAFSRLYSKWNNSKVNFFAGGIAYATGGIVQKHADGFIANKPGDGVDITRHIAGEAGAEAIIPLTNKHYVRPFAETVAEFIEPSGVTITGNTFVVRNQNDITAIGREISQEVERQRRSHL